MLGEGLDKPTSPHMTWIDASHNLLKVRNPEVECGETLAVATLPDLASGMLDDRRVR
jgi:hypothetical protein